eukprot:2999759-Rhodomonas_salina.4
MMMYHAPSEPESQAMPRHDDGSHVSDTAVQSSTRIELAGPAGGRAPAPARGSGWDSEGEAPGCAAAGVHNPSPSTGHKFTGRAKFLSESSHACTDDVP